ncbi:hypothetical protein Agub_g8849 [Astrephomene gubernaculifera]|uniref:YdbS-like PH domain-containing protein n=1 Tax=Astrephomene gubernaculifera TaxID=47775 RepID=A0AAD3DSP1_9CHLO|nr:hypothetical protein Agub_g8849 [Astrephomene gubernaculifera]
MLQSMQANSSLSTLRSPRLQGKPVLIGLRSALTHQAPSHGAAPLAPRGRERVVMARAMTEGEEGPSASVVETPTAPSSTSSPSNTSGSTPSSSSGSSASETYPGEEIFYEGPGSNAELLISLLLLPTLFYAPLSIASIGRRLWITFKFTNKRLTVTNTSPLFSRTIEVPYSKIKEIRAGPRGFGLWGDMVVFLRDGSRLELTGLEKYREIADHINRCIYTL